jgi:hypothetical protein
MLEGGEGVPDMGCTGERRGAMEEGTVCRPHGEHSVRRPLPPESILPDAKLHRGDRPPELEILHHGIDSELSSDVKSPSV